MPDLSLDASEAVPVEAVEFFVGLDCERLLVRSIDCQGYCGECTLADMGH